MQEIKGAGSKVYLMCDMAHIAGLVATGHHPSPFPYADIVTSTTHKTLRGPRSGIILCNDNELAKAVDSAVFPKSQGGPLEHVIAAKAICFTEALSSTFYEYIDSVVKNTKACQDYFAQLGMIVSGTDNHLFLLNTWESYHLTGAEAQKKLEAVGITTNKNMLPGDIFKPNVTSGLRIGLAAITSRGCNIALATEIASVIHHTLNGTCDEKEAKKAVKKIIKKLKRIPL